MEKKRAASLSVTTFNLSCPHLAAPWGAVCSGAQAFWLRCPLCLGEKEDVGTALGEITIIHWGH